MAHTVTGLDVIEKTFQKTNEWIKDAEDELSWPDRHFAFQALRAVLHVLRDRLPVREAVDLGDQLPILVRGLYYERWNPARVPVKDRRAEDFLARLLDYFPKEETLNTELMARAIFRVLDKHVSAGEIRHIHANLPREIRDLWR